MFRPADMESMVFLGKACGDFSWALGMAVAALLYWALAVRNVRDEAAATQVRGV